MSNKILSPAENDIWKKLEEFHVTFNRQYASEPSFTDERTLLHRVAFAMEETTELINAYLQRDLPKVADALIDRLYILVGDLICFGIPLQALFDEVHRSNMAKQGGHDDGTGKWIKPAGWTPPDLESILVKLHHRARRSVWMSNSKLDPVLIGLSGKLKSGKTTTAIELVKWADANGFTPLHLSIARWVKQLCRFGLHADSREAFQRFGTEVIREGCGKWFPSGADFWVNLCLHDVEQHILDGYNFIVIDDVRFYNEAWQLKQNGFKIVRLQTTPDLQASREDDPAKKTSVDAMVHESETALDSYESLTSTLFDMMVVPDLSIDQIKNCIIHTLGPWDMAHDFTKEVSWL